MTPPEGIAIRPTGNELISVHPDPQLAFYAAFIKAQGEFDPAIKNKTNPAFRQKYADLEAVYDACREALQNNNIGIIQKPGMFVDGCLLMTTKLFHVDGGGEEQVMSVPVPSSKQDAQGIGSAITYMRRYALLAFLGIPTEDDDGNAVATDKRDTTPRQNTPAHAPQRPTEQVAAAPEAMPVSLSDEEYLKLIEYKNSYADFRLPEFAQFLGTTFTTPEDAQKKIGQYLHDNGNMPVFKFVETVATNLGKTKQEAA